MKLILLSILPFLVAGVAVGSNNPKAENTKEETIINTNVQYSSSANNSNLKTDQGVFSDLTDDQIKEYYSDLETGIKGDELLDQLQEIISDGHTQVSYANAWRSNWYYFKLLDRNYELTPLTSTEISTGSWSTSGNIWINPLYTEDYQLTSSTTIGRIFNREHMWPQSRGFKYLTSSDTSEDEKPYAGTDMHNLRMGEYTNNQSGHNNYPYGNVANKNTASQITDSVTGNVTGWRGQNEDGITVYEPRDEDKGDIARALFYMAARYHNFVDVDTNQPALALTSTFVSTSASRTTINTEDTESSPATYGILSDLLEWHEEDPVDYFEIHRNNLVYNIVQGNRNPFVDYPEWANIAFGDSEYGVNINSTDGVLRASLAVTPDKDTYYQGNTIDLANFSFVYTDDNNDTNNLQVDNSNLRLSITYGSSSTDERAVSTYVDNYIFENLGTYTLNFSYYDGSDTYTATVEITVEQNAHNGLYVDASKTTYYQGNILGIVDDFTFNFYNKYGNKEDISYDNENLSLEIKYGDSTLQESKKVSEYLDNFTFDNLGTYTLDFVYKESEQISYGHTISIEVVEKTYQDDELIVDASTTTYYQNAKIQLDSNFTFSYYNKYGNKVEVPYNDDNLTLEIVFDTEVIEEAKSLSEYLNYMFTELGTYTLNFIYIDGTDTYNASLDITILERIVREAGLVASTSKTSYTLGQSLNLASRFTFYYYDEDSNRINIEYTDENLTLGIYLNNATIPQAPGIVAASQYDDYTFETEGTYKLTFSYTTESEILTTTVTIEASESLLNTIIEEYGTYIVIGGVVVIVLIVIFVVAGSYSKKKSKKK